MSTAQGRSRHCSTGPVSISRKTIQEASYSYSVIIRSSFSSYTHLLHASIKLHLHLRFHPRQARHHLTGIRRTHLQERLYCNNTQFEQWINSKIVGQIVMTGMNEMGLSDFASIADSISADITKNLRRSVLRTEGRPIYARIRRQCRLSGLA